MQAISATKIFFFFITCIIYLKKLSRLLKKCLILVRGRGYRARPNTSMALAEVARATSATVTPYIAERASATWCR